MANTRRSARLASSQGSQVSSSPPASHSSPKPAAGSKRKSEAGASPSAKRGKKDDDKKQATIEDTMDIDHSEQKPAEDSKKEAEKTEPAPKEEVSSKQQEEPSAKSHENEPAQPQPQVQSQHSAANGHTEKIEQPEHSANGDAGKKEQPKEHTTSKPSVEGNSPKEPQPNESTAVKDEEPKQSEESKTSSNGDAVIANGRKEEPPSSILEKGVVYFLFRGRVGIDEPSNVSDIARTYILLRPIPLGAKLGDGPIGDEKNCRLLAVPKKVLPLSGKDRWIAFVEKASTSFKELKDTFFGASDYETQTAGTRHVPAVVPAAEGIYAITTTGRESHLAYMMTLPQSLGEVQNDLGLREKGSFITSVKNPQYPGPANTNIGKDPGYSQEILDEFRSLRWAPLQPKHLNHEGCQFLLVGESVDKALSPSKEDEKKDKETPREEMEKLEGEDEIRVKHLDGDDAIFADLTTDAQSYSGLQTTW